MLMFAKSVNNNHQTAAEEEEEEEDGLWRLFALPCRQCFYDLI